MSSYGFPTVLTPVNTKPSTVDPYGGGFPGKSPVAVPPAKNTSGMSNDPMHDVANAHAPVQHGMTASQVRAMQQFLNNHGFQVAQDGILGPLTKSAAAAFRANHKGGDAWNKANGIGVHPGAKSPHDMPLPSDTTGGSLTAPGAATASNPMSSLIASMLGSAGAVGSGYDVKSFGDAAAAPDDALVAAYLQQVAANPKQEAQNQSDISSWYGLDPKASSYKLSVLDRLAQAKAADSAMTSADVSNLGDLAKALAGSIGGSANDGSSTVLSAGENAAGTASALGQAQSDYESNMDPLLRAEAVGAASRERASNSQALADLADKLAQARGQATADRAQGVMTASDKNNALAQQRFANQGNLLSLEAQMAATDPNSAKNLLDSAKTQAQIREIDAQTTRARAAAAHLANSASTTAKLKSANIGDLVQQISGIAGVGIDHRLPDGVSMGGLAHLVGTTLQTAGIPKSDPRYQRIAQTIMGSFLDRDGNPLSIPPRWFGPGTR